MIPLERFVTVSGRSLFVLEAGSGRPTVIFESGLGDFSGTWHRIQAKIAESAHTISYDRAGRGQSHFAGESRTLNDCLDDLVAMLAAVEARPPYVFVAHSFGGFIARIFVQRYPDEVGGVVLVDSAQEDFIFDIQKILKSRTLPPRRFDEPNWFTWRRFDQAQHSDPQFPRNILNDEGIDLTTCYEQVREASSLGALPLTLVSSTKRDDDRKIMVLKVPSPSGRSPPKRRGTRAKSNCSSYRLTQLTCSLMRVVIMSKMTSPTWLSWTSRRCSSGFAVSLRVND